MARQSLTVQLQKTLATAQSDNAGLTPTFVAADANGAEFINDEQSTIRLKGGAATSSTITVQHPGTRDGMAVADLTIVVGNNEDHEIGPFPPGFHQEASKLIYIDFSSVTDLTVAVVSLRSS